jgi:hypothetical protein
MVFDVTAETEDGLLRFFGNAGGVFASNNALEFFAAAAAGTGEGGPFQ